MILGVNLRLIFSKKFLVYLLLICFSSCDTFMKEEITGSVYGTTYKIQYYVESYEGFNFSKQIDSIFDEIDFSMSTYKSNSIISRINKNEVLEIPMSEYQFVKYAYVRKQEIDADKNKKKKEAN